MKKQIRKEKLNLEIKNQKIRLVGESFNGDIVTLKEALTKSDELGLDLVLVSENNDIGVCKIMNYEKFIYEQSKKEKQKILDIKEIKVGPNTSENDLSYRIKRMIEFLQKGHRIKISMQFKGREMSFVSKGELVMLNMVKAVEEYGLAEALPKLENKKMFITIKPKSSK